MISKATLLEILLLTTASIHVVTAPYTKVEESFSLHAVHDILQRGVYPHALPKFDHVEFAGPVPRSFVGPLLLSAASWPVLAVGTLLGGFKDGLVAQITIRLVLATVSAASLIFLSRRVRTAFGPQVARYTLLLTITQFHLLFWISRTLPNMFAFPLGSYSVSLCAFHNSHQIDPQVQVVTGIFLEPKGPQSAKGKGAFVEVLVAFGILTFAAIVMRLELVALLGPFVLETLWSGPTRLRELFVVGLIAAVASLGVTVGVDSYFWGRLVWPEGSAIFFNVVEGHASDWGISPWHYYFTSALPRILNFSFPLALFTMLVDRRARKIGFPALAFVAALSCLGHKEWRFFVYVIPVLNICAAAGLQTLQSLYSPLHRRVALVLIIGTNLLLASVALVASSQNYPGGVAITQLALLRNATDHTPLSIHLDSHSAMTGASRFLHSFATPQREWYLAPSSFPSNWDYNKSESLSAPQGDFDQFDVIVTGHSERHERDFEVVLAVEGFRRFRVGRPEWGGKGWEGISPLKIVREEEVWVMKKRIEKT